MADKGKGRDFSGKCDECGKHKPYLYLNATNPKKVSKECWDCIKKSLPPRKTVAKAATRQPVVKKTLKKKRSA